MARAAKSSPKALAGALVRAAKNGDVQQVKELLAKNAPVDGRPPGEPTALIAAASAGQLEAMKVLLDAGADVNFVHGGKKEGTTALHDAVEAKQFEAARLLVAAGADVNFGGGRR